MEEQEEGFCAADIAACRDGFYAALKRVQAALAKPVPVAAPKPEPKPVALPPIPGPYIVYFAFDSSDLDAKAMTTINEAATDARGAKITKVMLNGHTDRSGANAYNMKLSQSRVDAVTDALVRAGMSRSSVVQSRFGEDVPAVSTPDGKREAKNRRVNITFDR
ncbi:MAG: OmpA family protein [Alphaproteobacteria bacterium]|nr:OmpA family protein [Alphaproteobacteria bacterium]